jgi:hypothetical protein
MVRTKKVDKLYYRGGRLHHEAKGKGPRKRPLAYRGKGAKTERRSARSRKRRERG